MNCLVKKPKTHQKAGSDLNSNFQKTMITSSAMLFRTNIASRGNNSSSTAKKSFKLGNKSNSNNKFSGTKSLENSGDLYNNNHNSIEEKETKVDEISLNTDQNTLNNNYNSYISNNIMYNNYNKRVLVISSRNINKKNKNIVMVNKNLVNNSTNENESSSLSKSEYTKLKSNGLKENAISYINNANYNNGDNRGKSLNNLVNIKKNTNNQRCRHKQVKREIYLNNNDNNNKYFSNNDIFNSSRKIRHNIINVGLNNITIDDNGEKLNKIENKENSKEEKNINNNIIKNKTKVENRIKHKEKIKSNKVLKNMNNKYIIKTNKKKESLPENAKFRKKIEKSIEKNRSSKTSKKKHVREKINIGIVAACKQEETIEIKNHDTIKAEKQRNFSVKVNKNYKYNPSVSYKIKKQISPIPSYLNLNSGCNDNNPKLIHSNNKIKKQKTKSKNLENNKKKSINAEQKLNLKRNIPEIRNKDAKTIDIDKIRSKIQSKSLKKKIVHKTSKKRIIKSSNIKNCNIQNESNMCQSNLKDNKINNNESSFNEEELDENAMPIFKEKNTVQKKKSSNKANKVLYFETGSSEIFDAYRLNKNLISINKNKSFQSITDQKNLKVDSDKKLLSQGNNISKEISNNNIDNINVIIKKNLDYNKKFFNKRSKKSLINKNIKIKETDNSNNDQVAAKSISNDNIVNDENVAGKIKDKYNEIKKNSIITPDIYSSDSASSISLNSTIKNASQNFIKHMKIKHKKHDILDQLLNVLNIKNFVLLFINFCDVELLNKFCLLSKNIYIKIKPEIYDKIKNNIYRDNKFIKNSKIKRKFMGYSPLSKISSVLLQKKYIDLLYETNNKYDVEIKKDLTRTLPDNALFNYGCENYNKLYHVLTAYSNYNKNIGYVQGLNFLAAHIIYVFESEVEVFVFLDALIKRYDFDALLGLNSNKLSSKLESISNFINKNLPQISQYFSSMKLNFSFITTNWVLTLFANSMDNKHLFYVWDFLIIFGWKFFKCFVVAVFKNFEENILGFPQSRLNLLMKNILKSAEFCSKFKKIISDSMEYMIKIDC